jgi:hypothetical protein
LHKFAAELRIRIQGNNILPLVCSQRLTTRIAPVLWLALVSISWAGEPASHSEFAHIQIETVTLSHIDADAAELEIRVTGTALKSAAVKSIFFQRVMVNGIAIRVPPIKSPLKLRDGQNIINVPVLTATLSFREVRSLRPLRQMVDDGVAQVHAVALVELELNPLQMFALFSRGAWAAVNIDQEVAIELPGGILGRAATLAALRVAEPVWVLGSEGREWRSKRSAFAAQAEEELNKISIPIECSYEISSRAGETRVLRSQSFGFILPSGRILTTAEAIEPWTFDSAIAEALARHEITVTEDSIEISSRPQRQAAGFSTDRNELKVRRQHAGKKHMVSAQDKTSYRLRFRDSDDNAALLEFKGFRPSEQFGTVARIVRGDGWREGEWRSAAVLRTDLEAQTAPYVWITEIKKENGRYVLRDPAGVTAQGSPIWTEDGVTGLLQDDGSGASVANILKSFSSEIF